MKTERVDWIATDLDGTLFSRVHEADAVAGTWRRSPDGESLEPSSWMPAERHALFAGLVREFRVVAVTARDADSFSRVRIEGVPLRDGAILANGAVALRPGTMEPDEEWNARIGPELAEWAEPLREMAAVLSERTGGRVVPRLVASATRHPAYLVAKATDGYWSDGEGMSLREALMPFRCRIAEIGRELQVLPPPVGKQRAVRAFARLFCDGVAPVLALGDMPEDVGFLSEAAFFGAPSGSKLAEGWCDGI